MKGIGCPGHVITFWLHTSVGWTSHPEKVSLSLSVYVVLFFYVERDLSFVRVSLCAVLTS